MTDASSAVRWLLDQREPEARRVAVQQIVKVRGRDATELLLRALADDDWRVRKEAAYVAPAVEPRDEVVAALIAGLEERVNIGLRNAAVEALVSVGVDALPAAIEALAKLDADGRKLAIEVLGGVPDVRGVEALSRALTDDDANVRVAAAEALGNAALAGEMARDHAITALLDVLSASEMFLKLAALDSLSRLDAQLPWKAFEPFASDPLLRRHAIAAAAGSQEPSAIETLAIAVGDGSPTVAREATAALADAIASGAYDEGALAVARAALARSPRAGERLRALARDREDARGRGAALVVLGLSRAAEDAAMLVEALVDEDVGDRAELGITLFGARAAPILLAAARTAPQGLRAAILSLLPQVAPAGDAATRAAFRAAVDDEAPEVVASGLKGLGVAGEAEDLARVAPRAIHDEPRVVVAATTALANLCARYPDAARALALRIDATAPDAIVGCLVLSALGASSAGEAEVGFLQRALSHASAGARRAAVDALAAIGGSAAADLVAFALADEEHEVQLAAVRALGQLGRSDALASVIVAGTHKRGRGASHDPALVVAALRALAESDPPRAFASARPLVRGQDAAIACAAVEAVGRLARATRGARAEDVLFEALEHPDPEVVKVALSEIATEPDARALARLGLCLDHPSWEVRRLAAELLGQDGGPAAQALLHARFDREKDPVVREAITTAFSTRPDALLGRHPSTAGASLAPPAQSGLSTKLDPTLTLKPGEKR